MCLTHCSHSLLRGERENLSEEVAPGFVISPAGNRRREGELRRTQKPGVTRLVVGAPRGVGRSRDHFRRTRAGHPGTSTPLWRSSLVSRADKRVESIEAVVTSGLPGSTRERYPPAKQAADAVGLPLWAYTEAVMD